jgi:leucyl aminopeptidase
VEVIASTQPALTSGADTIAAGVFADESLARDLTGGGLQTLLDRGEARATFGHLALLHHDEQRVIVIGLGPRGEFDPERARVAAAAVQRRARELATDTLAWELPSGLGPEHAAALVEGTLLSGYRFTRYRPAPAGESPLTRLIISAEQALPAPVARAEVLARAQNRARDLANLAPNDLTPTALAEYAQELAATHDGVQVGVLDGDEIRAQGMGAFSAVAQGSAQPAQLIELIYDSGAQESPWLALVGKAVTFDTGGLTLKPPARMMEMKFDMCGGAAVIEAVAALAELRAPVRIRAVVGAVENLPGPEAVKPADIVTALDGTTIEVDNPDAEGRMVLADCITYARRRGCAAIVDVATLTGAVEGALGFVYAGVMSNDDTLTEQIRRCGERTGELVWPLPLHPRYAEMTRGRSAVLTNRPEPRVALASAAAEFLHHFTGDVPWAHLDMFAVAFKSRLPYLDRGGTGWGVRLLSELALEWSSLERSA